MCKLNLTDRVEANDNNRFKLFSVLFLLCTRRTARVPQRYTYRVLQTIQMKLILLYVWAEQAVLGRAKTALKFKYEI